jgi:hypothetical protein
MKRIMSFTIIMLTITVVISSCKKKEDEQVQPTTSTAPPRLVFKFVFNSNQARLNNIGQPSAIGTGNAAQSPVFKLMSQHYIELANTFDLLGQGKVLYHAPETNLGGSTAIDHSQAIMSTGNETFFSVPLSTLGAGSYEWLRVSLAAQFYDITYKSSLLPGNQLGTGTIASFIGYKTYMNNYKINGHTYTPSSASGGVGNHLQGYWGFETTNFGTTTWIDGQAPAGATTVPNPIFNFSPIPQGSCVVTGQFVNSSNMASPLVITGNETQDIVITVSLSTNNSFEWHEVNADGYYEPANGEYVVDMGIRGLIPYKN